ncbi:MAG: hypothetical protein J5671_09930 [Bacteroidaceae bacterium]|nr:hypothetical protein [Bacteroidaceae bacterium]
MKKILVAAVALICITTNVVAQQKTSVFKQKGDQLIKAADADPQNWRKQYDAGDFFISIDDTVQSAKYAQRAFEIAQKMQAKKDTIMPKTLELLAGVFMKKNDYERAIFHLDMAIRAYVEEFGYQNKLIPPAIANVGCMRYLTYMMRLYPYGDVDALKNLREANILNSQLPEGQRAIGLEESETIAALASENLLGEHRNRMKDKVWKWTNHVDGKTYTILAFNNWTLEQPEGFIAELLKVQNDENAAENMKHGLILMDEQGKVIEQIHGEFTWNVWWNVLKEKFTLNENSTLRLATVTPEQRQQMIDALNGRRQQIMDNFKKRLEEPKTPSSMSISPGALNINKSLNNNKSLQFRFKP